MALRRGAVAPGGRQARLGRGTMSGKILVTGASGHLGRRVVELLLEAGAPAVAGSRSPEKLGDLVARGAEARAVDFDAPEGLVAAFQGVERLLIVSTDALGTPGLRLKQHLAAVAAAKEAGVKHLYYTSMPQPEAPSPIPFAPDHEGTEAALKASGLTWTVLGNAWYFENLLGAWTGAVASGRWFVATGAGTTPYVSREDCAQAAAAALLKPEAVANRKVEVNGPEDLSAEAIAQALSEVVGRPVAAVQVSDEALVQGMIQAGVPEAWAPFWLSFDVNAREGRSGRASGEVEALTGRAPQRLRAFFEAHREAFLQPSLA